MTSRFRIGQPCWLDLNSNDPDETRAFYRELFGWEFETPPGPHEYSLIRCGGHTVGGFVDSREMTCPNGEPITSGFGIFLRVADAAETAAAARTAGVEPQAEAMSAGRLGAFTFFPDPGGALIHGLEPGELDGFDTPLQPGTPVWFECRSTSFDQAADFYREIFDWTPVPMEAGPEGSPRYLTNGSPTGVDAAGNPCEAVCGLVDASGMEPAHRRSVWQVFFGTADLDASLAAVTQMGGRHEGIGRSPFGRFSQVHDPQGATFMLNEM